MADHISRRAALALLLSASAALAVAPADALAAYAPEDLEKLTPEQRERLAAYQVARTAHGKQAAAYWAAVEGRRALRRKKTAAARALAPEDYVQEHPPVYAGPSAPTDVLAVLRKPPKEPPKPIPVVPDFLRGAADKYGFAPMVVSEEGFKTRYAAEALRLKFTKEQIVRVYAFETGGYGVYDMQAGYNPLTKKVNAISTALGYAQLLAANSVEVLGKHGPAFAARLDAMGALTAEASRSQHLRRKASVVRAMARDARGVRGGWPGHVRYGTTPKGLGMHAMNLDADVGPWMQIQKLDNTREYGVRRGLNAMSGAELEMMNLAGPARGFEMMTPLGRAASTANFFDRGGYERNPVVHNRTGAELMAKMNEIMDRNSAKDGARQFAAIFDRLIES
ncbi:MAG: hypothetical protein NW215_01640 [Hyphomicrobiales bacterium]|nr:hypothetical protein [Hyphomicrobiales bacterium]